MGKPSPGLDLAVLDEQGNRVVNQEGDISVLMTPVSDKVLFKGYRRVVNGRTEFIRPETTDKTGQQWYRTGDRGYVDEDGYFWFIGRADDVLAHLTELTAGNKFVWLPNRPIRSRICVEGIIDIDLNADDRNIRLSLNPPWSAHQIQSVTPSSKLL